MNVTTEPPEHCEVLMTVEMDEQEADNLLKTAARRIARQVQIPGFRPGKAPYRQVVQRVGEDAVRSEALEDLGERVFKEALEQSELEPFSPASMEDISWSPLVMKVRVPVEPMVDIGDYRAQRMEAEPVEVGEDDVDEALAELQDEHATWNPVERPAELGDTMVTDIEERDGDRVLGKGEEVEYVLVAVDEDDARPDLTTPLLGLSAGDEKTFDLFYPESNSNPDYAGKEIAVSVKVHRVMERETYPLDDDFAQSVGDFGNIEELKAKLAQDLRQKGESEADAQVAGKMLEHIIDNADPLEWHQSLEEGMLDRWLEDVDSNLQENGLTLDVYLATQKKTPEQFREEYRPSAQARIRRMLVISELIKQEGLSVEGEEVIDRIGQMSLMAGERGDNLRQALATEDGVTAVAQKMLDAKVQERLVQIAKGEGEAKAEVEAEAEVRPKAKTKPKAKVEAKDKGKAKAEVETGAEAEVEVEAEAEVRPKAKAKPKAKVKPKAKAKAKVEAKDKGKAKAEAEAGAEAEVEVEAEVKPKAKGKGRAEVEGKAEPEASSPQAEPESQP